MSESVVTPDLPFDPEVRPVTDSEISTFFQDGWVKVPGLISRGAARNLLERARGFFGDDGCENLSDVPPATQGYQRWFRSNQNAHDDSRFRALAHSNELGRNTARLLGRDSSIRLTVDAVMAKLPQHNGLGEPTDFHQDSPGHTYLEGDFLTVWVALDSVGPDMGAMQFYTGSHKLGCLGNLLDPKIWSGWEARIKAATVLTPPIELEPGDATFHRNNCVHGTTANCGNRPRWSWAGVLVPGDARYTGAASPFTDGLGFSPRGQMDHPALPIIYPGRSSSAS